MSRRRAVAILFLVNIGLEIAFVTGLVSGPTLLRVFDLSKTQLGILLGMLNIGYVATSTLAGHTTQRWGAFQTLTVGVCGVMAGVLCVICASSYWMLTVGFGVLGLAGAFVGNSTTTLLTDIYPDKIRRIMTLAAALWLGSSAITAPVVGCWLGIAAKRGWDVWGVRTPFCIDFVVLTLSLIAMRRIIGRSGHGRKPDVAERLAQAEPDAADLKYGRNRWWWIPWLSVLHGTMLLTMTSWINPMVQGKFHVGEFSGALLLGVISLGMGLGRITLAAVEIPWDERTVLGVSALMGAALFSLGLFMPTYGATIAVMAVGSVAACATYPSIMSVIGIQFPRRKAYLYGYMSASIGIAGVAGPSLVGWLADLGLPIHVAILLSPLAALFLGISGLVWLRLERRKGSGAPVAVNASGSP